MQKIMSGSKEMIMQKSLLYILGAVTLVSCSDDEVSPFLNGKDKSPITVATNLKATNTTTTRAVDATFEENDALVAYIKHVTVENAAVTPLVYAADVTGDGVGPRLANFKVIEQNQAVDNYTDKVSPSLSVTDVAGLYWDDFSNNNSEETDLRTNGHALMVQYGYCFNGRTPAPSLTAGTAGTPGSLETGTVSWSVETDQTSGFRSSDLLYAKTQTPVPYNRGTSVDDNHGVLNIPYTHAMSKVTITVVCSDGFDLTSDNAATKNFGNAAVSLSAMETTATVKAPSAEVSLGTNPENILMQKGAASKTECTFSALIAPTVLTDGQEFAKLTGFEGNNYTVYLSDAIIDVKEGEPAETKSDAWSTQLAAATTSGSDPLTVTPEAVSAYTKTDGGLTKPGVHYHLTVTIKKQAISVSASVTDWTTVYSTVTGDINFENDITVKGNLDAVKPLGAFDVYRKGTDADAVYGSIATTYTYNNETVEWSRDKEIYWQNKDDNTYFRALAPAGSSAETAYNGTDLVWGTSGDDAISPRTGDVELAFEHIMSKITVNLYDGNASSTDPAARLDLKNATIQLINLATDGTIDLHTGAITAGNIATDQKTFEEDTNRPGYYAANNPEGGETTPLVKDYCVIPQEISDDVRIIITLADGTRYNAQFNQCVVKDTSTLVDTWEKGKHYIYEITIGKEHILFRALIKAWEPVETSGNATLEWD